MSPEARRLHRAAIGVYVLRSFRDAALPLVVIVAVSVFRGGLDVGSLVQGAVFGAIGVAGAAVAGWWRWDTTRWWVDENGIHKRSGLFTTKQTDVPWARIQALDLQHGPVQRRFGVSAVHVQTGGGGAEGEIVLEAIWDEELEGLRALVAARTSTPTHLAPPGAPDSRVSERRLGRTRLVVAALTAGQLGVIVPALAGAAQLAQNALGDEAGRDAVRLIPHSAHEWVIAAAVLLVAAWLLSVAGAVIAFSGFRVVRDGERLRIRRGLLEQRETTIPVERVRAVVVTEGVLRRPLGLAALRLEVIGHAKEPAAAQILFPLLRRGEVPGFLEDLLPELADDLDGLSGLPSRALRRYALPPAVVALAIAIPIAPYSFVLVPLAAWWGTARYRAAGWRLRDGHLAARRLLLARTTVLAPAARHESVTLGQTVLQRRGRLADLVVAFGKRTKARVHHLDAADARDAFTALTGSPPPPSPVGSRAGAT